MISRAKIVSHCPPEVLHAAFSEAHEPLRAWVFLASRLFDAVTKWIVDRIEIKSKSMDRRRAVLLRFEVLSLESIEKSLLGARIKGPVVEPIGGRRE